MPFVDFAPAPKIWVRTNQITHCESPKGLLLFHPKEKVVYLESGAEGTRTPDPLHAMQVRYQLRHSPKLKQIVIALLGGQSIAVRL